MPDEDSGFNFVDDIAPEDEPIGKAKPKKKKLTQKNIVSVLSQTIVTPRNANTVDNHAVCMHGKLRMVMVECEAEEDGDEGSQFVLCKLDPGRVRVFSALSMLECQFKDDNMTFDLGVPPYASPMRGRNPGDMQAFGEVITPWVGVRPMLADGKIAQEFTTKEGLYVVATLDGKVTKGDFIRGYIVYVRD